MLIAPDTVGAGNLAGAQVGHLFLHAQLFFPYDQMPPGIYYAPLPVAMTDQLKSLKSALVNRRDRLPDPSTLFLAHSIALFGFSALPAEIWPERQLDPAIVRAVIEMEQAPERAYSNEAMAAAAHMSLSTFLRRFKRATQRTPHRFLIDKRLEKAYVMLSSTDELLDQVAETCGFGDRFSLSRQFKARYGMTPSRCRQLSYNAI